MTEGQKAPKFPFEHEPIGEGQSEFIEFRKEITAMSKDKKLAGHFIYTKEFEPDELTVDDLRMWKAVKDGTITMERIMGYQKRNNKKDMTPSRIAFQSIVANQANVIIGERELEALRKQIEQE